MAVRKEAPEATKARAYTLRVHIAAHPGEGNPACSLTALPQVYLTNPCGLALMSKYCLNDTGTPFISTVSAVNIGVVSLAISLLSMF